MAHIDRFSDVAEAYAQYRPGYPDALYSHIYKYVRAFDTALDTGTGNGQVAMVLAQKFTHVYATDISTEQLAQAQQHAHVTYVRAPAEHSGLPDASVDLVTTAQAAHWFDLEAFGSEVQRICKPGSVLALWGYGVIELSPEIDALIYHLYAEILDGYWDPQRIYIDHAYADFSFPFEELPGYADHMTHQRTVKDLTGYLRTWSAARAYQRKHGIDPVSLIEDELSALMGSEKARCSTPVFLRLWRVS